MKSLTPRFKKLASPSTCGGNKSNMCAAYGSIGLRYLPKYKVSVNAIANHATGLSVARFGG